MPLWATTMLALAGSALAEPAVRVEAVGGYDSNATRSEGTSGEGSPVTRLVVDLSDRVRPAKGWLLDASYQGGVRTMPGGGTVPCGGNRIDAQGEDALFHRLDAGLRAVVVDRLTVGGRLELRDRSTRAPCHARDFTHLRGTIPVAWSRDGWRVSVAGVGERFHYKPDTTYDSTTLGGRLGLGWSTGRWTLSASGGLLERRYGAGDDPPDGALRLGFGVRYGGPVLVSARYGYSANDARREESRGYDRHAITLGGTAPLPGSIYLSGRVSLVRILHDEALLLPDDQTLRDEGRSAVTLRLERPVSRRWSVVVHGGWWGSPFETGPAYDRWLALAGLGYGSGN